MSAGRLSLSPARAAAVACAVGVLAYANALGNGFAYDDVQIVVEDPALADVSALPGRLLEPYWPEDVGGDLGLWRPLTTAVLGVQRQLVGLDPTLFHGVNVVLHGLVSALVVLLAAELVPLLAALLAGLVFAVHPVHVEAVANVVGLAEMLSAIPYLTACLLFLRWTREEGKARAPLRAERVRAEGRGSRLGPVRIATLGALYGLAFLAKESAATLPAALLTLDLVRRPVAVRAAGGWLGRRAPLLAALAVVAAAVLGGRWAVLGALADPDAPLGARLLGDVPRIWTLGVVWLHYVRLLVLPVSLAADYSPDVIPVLTVWTAAGVAGVVVTLGLLGAALLAWRAAGARAETLVPPLRLPALAVVWFLVTVAPVANVFFLSGVLLAERTLYLPSVGFAVGLGWLLGEPIRRRSRVGVGIAAALLLLYAGRAWTRTPTWESTERVFLTLAEEHPRSGRALWMVGDLLARRGEVERANVHYRRAAGALDSSPWFLREVGWAAVGRGDDRLGEFLLLRAWEEQPEHLSPPRRLALLYARQGRHPEVVTFARRVLERQPDNVIHWHLLAGSLEALGEWDAAVEARERVLALGEDPWQQWLSLARLRLTVGDTLGAERALEEALSRAPDPETRAAIRAGFVPVRPRPAGPG